MSPGPGAVEDPRQRSDGRFRAQGRSPGATDEAERSARASTSEWSSRRWSLGSQGRFPRGKLQARLGVVTVQLGRIAFLAVVGVRRCATGRWAVPPRP